MFWKTFFAFAVYILIRTIISIPDKMFLINMAINHINKAYETSINYFAIPYTVTLMIINLVVVFLVAIAIFQYAFKKKIFNQTIWKVLTWVILLPCLLGYIISDIFMLVSAKTSMGALDSFISLVYHELALTGAFKLSYKKDSEDEGL